MEKMLKLRSWGTGAVAIRRPRSPVNLFALLLAALTMMSSAPFLFAATTTVALSKSLAVAGQELTSTVRLMGASRLVAMHMELLYDAKALELKSIAPGSLLGDRCKINADTNTPGRAILSIFAERPINGEGDIFKALFVVRPKASLAGHKLELKNVRARQAVGSAPAGTLMLAEMPVKTMPGEIRITDPPVPLWMLAIIVMVITIAAIVSLRDERDPDPSAAQ
jgi:hypothetical protein